MSRRYHGGKSGYILEDNCSKKILKINKKTIEMDSFFN